MVGTTKESCEVKTIQEIAAATKALEGISKVDNSSSGNYINMVRSGLIRNFPITPQSVTIANTIFGPDTTALKGKTTWKYSEPMVTDYVEILQGTLDMNKEVTMLAHVIFVNWIGFFVSTHQRIKVTTLEYLPSRTKCK